MTPGIAEGERRGFAVRVSLLFAALSVIIGTNLPFLPVWLDWAGLGAREIAVITATPLLVRVAVTPVIAFAADRAGDHRKFLIGLSWAGLAGLVAGTTLFIVSMPPKTAAPAASLVVAPGYLGVRGAL